MSIHSIIISFLFSQLVKSYCFATSGALATAITLNSLVKKFPPLIGRFVPLSAVAAANCVNIPMMRSSELTDGIAIFDENGEKIGNSKKMAKVAISQVVFSRILMATPGMGNYWRQIFKFLAVTKQ